MCGISVTDDFDVLPYFGVGTGKWKLDRLFTKALTVERPIVDKPPVSSPVRYRGSDSRLNLTENAPSTHGKIFFPGLHTGILY